METNNHAEVERDQEAPVSQRVVGVRFKSCGKVYTFEIDDIDVAPGFRVVVDSDMGLSLGRVATPKQIVEKRKTPLKKVLRIATEEDFATAANNRSFEDEARVFCMEKVKEMNLPMKIVTSNTTLDRKRLTFYFTADGRIDFRELVRDLAARFKTRIEMRQIGVRDEVKLLGGFGVCGRQTCCNLFLTSFAPITIKMAKEQALSINQSKLSGVCGRLMCCLGYEHREARADEALMRKEALVTVTEETPESLLEPLEAETFSGDMQQEQTEPRDKSGTLPDRKERVALPGQPPSPERPSEKGADRKKHFSRDRRRRHGRRKAKSSQQDTQSKQPPTPAPREGNKENAESAGRPHNRRRRFWKKKKA